MSNDYLVDLKYLGVTARIKRLSDSLSVSIKELYKAQGLEIEPSWHLVLLLLKNRQQVSMKEMAMELNLSKPALTKMINKMQKSGYVDISVDAEDHRKKLLCLSKKAKDELPVFEKVWSAGQRSVQQILEDNDQFFEALKGFETAHANKSFKDRALEILDED